MTTCVVLHGAVSSDVLPPELVATARRLPEPQFIDGRDSVSGLLALARRYRTSSGPVVLVTDRDLTTPECGSLFGFSDPRHQVAIVATARLAVDDAERFRGRIRNEIAHELGHLRGRRHCRDAACVMHAVTTAEELDCRPHALCAACKVEVPVPLLPRLLRAAAGFALLGLLVAGLRIVMAVAPALEPPFQMPFT